VERGDRDRDQGLSKRVPIRLNLGRNAKPIIHELDKDRSLQVDDINEDKEIGIDHTTTISTNNNQNSLPQIAFRDDRPITPSSAYLPQFITSSPSGISAATPVVTTMTTRPKKVESTASSVNVPTMHASLHAKIHAYSQAQQQPCTTTVSDAIVGIRRRCGAHGHIQLDILSGERLMPAKKGAPLKDCVADRKPGLKITMLLPTTSSSVLKKVICFISNKQIEFSLNKLLFRHFTL
jgi:hypothetical protein